VIVRLGCSESVGASTTIDPVLARPSAVMAFRGLIEA
jgi:hypothetical protein